MPGFCKSATIEEIRTQGYILTPGRYVGAADVEDDGASFQVKIASLTEILETQFKESKKLEEIIRQNLQRLDYDG